MDETTEYDPRATLDAQREHCPVTRNANGTWSVYRHQDVNRVVCDHETFSNRVSQHLSVPNGMDPPEHGPYRRLIERYFADGRMAAFEPSLRTIATRLASAAVRDTPHDFIDACAAPFAAQAQCAFLGWPLEHGEMLRAWVRRNREAMRRQDRTQLSELAQEFASEIEALLAVRRRSDIAPDQDITTELMHACVEGRPLTTDEIVSILRNWTVGEVGTIAASAGIVAHFLATHPEIQEALRADTGRIPYAIDEILRLDGPLASNRRRATCPATIAGQNIESGDGLSVVWIAANRDPAAFDHPREFHWDRDPAANLLYGAGIHVCPGAPLARLELRVIVEELLFATKTIEPVSGQLPRRASWPDAGFDHLPLCLRAR